MIKLSDEQNRVCDRILEWWGPHNDRWSPNWQQYITLGGYAGTGKTTLISYISDAIRYLNPQQRTFNIAFLAYTGKAAHVLKGKLKDSGTLKGNDFCGTIHRVMYYPKLRDLVVGNVVRKVIVGWEKKDDLEYYDLIIVDEASMVNKDIWTDLLSYSIPIIAVGDHGQLPPIGSGFNLMQTPHLVLNEIHRQAEGSEIIRLSKNIRETGTIIASYPSQTNSKVFMMDWNDPRCKKVFENIEFNEDIICLSGFNQTRVKLNHMIRKKYNYLLDEPYPGERIICLKNNYNTGIMNGQIGQLIWALPEGPHLLNGTLVMDGYEEPFVSLIHLGGFGRASYEDVFDHDLNKKFKKELLKNEILSLDFFDYGYATTVHKSQGSEWNRVILFPQRNSHQRGDEFKRWLYTGVTRAKEKLFVITNFW
jgi:exodeoxyribonuclease-5